MVTPVVTHSKVTGGSVDSRYSVDLHDWDAQHIVTGFENVPNVDTTNADNITLGSQTGTGAMVRGTTPTIATPVINGLPTGTGVSSGANASTLASRDVDGLSAFVNLRMGYATTATAAGTTTLTVGSQRLQYFTGTTTQTVTLPVTSTLVLGHSFEIKNDSTGIVTVNSSGGNGVISIPGGGRAIVTCILTSGTTAASWSFETNYLAVAGGKRPQINNSIIFAGTDGTTMTFPGTSGSVMTADSTSTQTNKTFDTAGAGNSFSINGVAATANTGTGSVVRATSPTLVTPTLGAATATSINVTAAPGTAWGFDAQNVSVAVAGSSNALLANGAGMILLTDGTSTGTTGMYLTGGSAAALVSQTGTAYVAPTTTPAANKYSIAFDGTNYRIYNGNAGSITFFVAMLRARPAI